MISCSSPRSVAYCVCEYTQAARRLLMSSRALSELVKNNTLYPLFVFCLRFFLGRRCGCFFSSKIDTCGRDFAAGNLLYFYYYLRSYHCIPVRSARPTRNSAFSFLFTGMPLLHLCSLTECSEHAWRWPWVSKVPIICFPPVRWA